MAYYVLSTELNAFHALFNCHKLPHYEGDQ